MPGQLFLVVLNLQLRRPDFGAISLLYLRWIETIEANFLMVGICCNTEDDQMCGSFTTFILSYCIANLESQTMPFIMSKKSTCDSNALGLLRLFKRFMTFICLRMSQFEANFWPPSGLKYWSLGFKWQHPWVVPSTLATFCSLGFHAYGNWQEMLLQSCLGNPHSSRSSEEMVERSRDLVLFLGMT